MAFSFSSLLHLYNAIRPQYCTVHPTPFWVMCLCQSSPITDHRRLCSRPQKIIWRIASTEQSLFFPVKITTQRPQKTSQRLNLSEASCNKEKQWLLHAGPQSCHITTRSPPVEGHTPHWRWASQGQGKSSGSRGQAQGCLLLQEDSLVKELGNVCNITASRESSSGQRLTHTITWKTAREQWRNHCLRTLLLPTVLQPPSNDDPGFLCPDRHLTSGCRDICGKEDLTKA